MFNPDREELAWAAGFFDGEGYTGLGGRPISPNIQIMITQKGLECLERFQQAIGGLGKIYEIKKNLGTYRWMVGSFEHAQAVIAMLWIFLSEPKRQQALAAFKSYHLPSRRRNRTKYQIEDDKLLQKREVKW